MSVVSIINTGNAIHMLTDGGLFKRGVVELITNKVRIFPHLKSAFAFRSSLGWWSLLIEQAGYSFESFDHVVDGITEFFRDGLNSIAAGRQLHGEELWFCGWSDERERFEAYGISSHGLRQDVHGVASEPWVLTRIEGNVIVPIDPTFYQRLRAFPTNTIEETGVSIAECQRQVIWGNSHGDDEILVGGHIQLTTVTKDMISQKILRSWPDKGVKVSFFDTTEPVSALSADTGSGGTKGLVPRPEAGDAAAGKFLHADGSWKRPYLPGMFTDSKWTEYTNKTVLNVTIPYDDTKPQQTEGTQVANVSITPKSTSSRIRITVSGFGVTALAGDIIVAAVFRDSGPDAIGAAPSNFVSGSDIVKMFAFSFEDSPGTTSAVNYRLRVGGAGGGVYLNGVASERRLGGVARTILSVDEISG